MAIERIIWDWNGTLLADVDVCVECMNELLSEYGLPLIEREYYRRVFCFPVQDYYAKLGFDFGKVPFEKTGLEFIAKYDEKQSGAGLTAGAREALARFSEAGFEQLVLSASEVNALKAQIAPFGIGEYFRDILGIDNRLAAGKLGIAQSYFSSRGISAGTSVLIGDTEHDADVAAALGAKCVLVANGHQTPQTLAAKGTAVAKDLFEAVGIIMEM